MTKVIASDKLTALIEAMCVQAGSDEGEARAVAENLVMANLMGHDSHGVGLIPRYVAHAADGRLTIDGHASVVTDAGAFLLLDGNMGYGQVVGPEAMAMGLAKAAEHGVAIVGLRNVHHLGRIGAWGELCAQAGFISIHYVNGLGHDPLVAPFGGYDARYSTNPYCTALPATPGQPPIVLDMATSRIAQGKARVAHHSGAGVPAGALVGADGQPTNDPRVLFEEPAGAMLSFGEHKGYGLALICDILAGGLTGGGTARPERHQGNTIRNNMLTIIIDPAGFRQEIPFGAEIDQLVAWVKSSRTLAGTPEIMVPGDPERKSLRARRRDGIPIDDNTWAAITECGVELGLDRLDFDAD